MKRVTVIGINHRTAPLAVRERAAIQVDDIVDRMQRLRLLLPGGECVLLSTCNRTEAYLTGLRTTTDEQAVTALLFHALSADERAQHGYVNRGAAAVRHIFTVAAGLDSMVVGETEILGQVKQAFARATEVGTVGRVFHPLFRDAFRTAKRVHSETTLCRGRVSVSSLAVQIAETMFRDLPSRCVMVIGAGDAAEGALKSLVERGVRDVLVVNRSAARLTALTQRFGARAIPLDTIAEHLPHADIVLSSTSAPHLILSDHTVRRAMDQRHERPLLLVDLAVPRDIAREAGEIAGVHLHDIDALQKIADANKANRGQAVKEAQAIVRASSAETLAESAARATARTARATGKTRQHA